MKVKKILIYGAFGPGAMEHQFVKGFQRLGLEVLCYEIQAPIENIRQQSLPHKLALRLVPDWFRQSLNRAVLAYAQAQKPEVILVFKGMDLFPDTIAALKAQTHLLCNYNPDHPFLFFSRGAGNAHVKNSIRHYDLFFSYAQNIVQQLQAQYGVQAIQIPFGYDSDLVPSAQTWPSIAQKVIFVGAWDPQRAAFFNQFAPDELAIFGPSEWASRTSAQSNTRHNYQGRALYDQDYIDVSAQALGAINLLRPQNIIESSHNMRTFEVPGYGGLLIAERTQEQQAFFTEGEEALYFSSFEELQAILQELTPARAQSIKQKARERAQRSGYSYHARSAEMLRHLEAHY